MSLQPPPRSVRLTAIGSATYGFLIMLVAAMLLGPPIAFFVRDKHEQTLIERGVLTRFKMIGSEQHRDSRRIVYVFEGSVVAGGTAAPTRHDSIVSEEDFATFADPQKRFVLYDPANPENAIPVTSRLALAKRHAFDRNFAVWFYPASTAIILLFSALGIRQVKRKLRLLRFGVAAQPAMTQPIKSRPCVNFHFKDLDGRLRESRQCFNFRIGIGADFAPIMRDAVVFYGPDDSRICELFLPEIATFMLVKN